MNTHEFRKEAHRLVDWIADYFETVEQYPVKSPVSPGDIIRQLPQSPPGEGEAFEAIFRDFQEIILPGVTHWQHPSFFAYFNSNNSFPSVLGEMLMSALSAQCMSWQTSPAAAELEERVMEWTAQLIGLSGDFTGVIQDTASTATVCSLLSAREKHSGYRVNREGLYNREKFIVYCSRQAHSSIEKAVKVIGFGADQLRKVEV
ncbi:MAG: aspartate aminotransferase family protein, partial [bacterium]|nr:aspartate aminotransferase family protein [bacterium]